MKTLVVVDCQNDFISGSLACLKGQEALDNIVEYIEKNKVNPVYTMDWHSKNNKSFKVNGGIWPIHCLENTYGAELSQKFLKLSEDKRPNSQNTYKKGLNDDIEEYSAFNGENAEGQKLHEIQTEGFIVCGIASEYCVRETVLELLKTGKKVSLLKNCLAYVNEEDHRKNLEDLKEKVEIK